jgi:hypothetical protein
MPHPDLPGQRADRAPARGEAGLDLGRLFEEADRRRVSNGGRRPALRSGDRARCARRGRGAPSHRSQDEVGCRVRGGARRERGPVVVGDLVARGLAEDVGVAGARRRGIRAGPAEVAARHLPVHADRERDPARHPLSPARPQAPDRVVDRERRGHFAELIDERVVSRTRRTVRRGPPLRRRSAFSTGARSAGTTWSASAAGRSSDRRSGRCRRRSRRRRARRARSSPRVLLGGRRAPGRRSSAGSGRTRRCCAT